MKRKTLKLEKKELTDLSKASAGARVYISKDLKGQCSELAFKFVNIFFKR